MSITRRYAQRAVFLGLGGALACLASISQASAQSAAKNACLYPFKVITPGVRACVSSASCDYGEQCVRGQCTPRPKGTSPFARSQPAPSSKDPGGMAPTLETSDEECSRDRRCRINRMRRQNTARRYVKQTQQEAQVMRAQKAYKDDIISDINRLVDPAIAEIVLNGDGTAAGLMAGYTFGATWRAEIGWLDVSDYAYSYDDTTGASLDGQVSLNAFFLNMTYLFRDSWWSPYASAGLHYNTGDYGSYFFDGFGESNSELEVTIHSLHASAGLDFQFGFGLRSRFGIVYRRPVYTRAASAPGTYDDFAKLGLESWYAESMSLVPEFSLGWAF